MGVLKSFQTYFFFGIIFLIIANKLCFSLNHYRQDTIIANVLVEKAKQLEDSIHYDSIIFYYEKAADVYKLNKVWDRYINCRNETIYQLLKNKPDKNLIVKVWENIGLAQKKLNATHIYIGDSYNLLGEVFYEYEIIDSAFQYFTKAMEIWKEHEENVQLRISKGHKNLANIYSDKGETNLAILNYNKALHILFKHDEKYQPRIADIYNNIGVLYYYSEQLDSCLAYYNKAFEITKNHYGQNHIKLARLYNNIGLIFNIQGKYPETIEYYNNAINITLENDPDNSSLVLYYNNIAICYKNISNYKKAKEFYSKALKLAKSIYGENHYYTGICIKNIGSIYSDKGDFKVALTYKKKGANIIIKHFGSDNPNSANAYSTLGLAYSDVKQLDTALNYFNKSLQLKLKAGVINSRTARSYNNIGATYKFMGDYELAKYYYERSLNIRTKVIGSDHIDNVPVLNNLGEILFLKGEIDTAIYYFEKNVNIITKNLGTKHAHLARAYLNLGAAYNENTQYNKSIECYNKGLKIVTSVYGKQHPTYINLCINLAHTSQNTGNIDSAIVYSKRAIQSAKLVYPQKHPEIGKTYETMGWIYSKSGMVDSAIVYFEKAVQSNYMSNELIDYNNLNVKLILDEIIFIETLNKYSSFLIQLFRETGNDTLLSKSLLLSQISLETINNVLSNFNLEESKITLMAKATYIIQNGLEAAWEYYKITGNEKYKSIALQFSEQNKATVLYKSLLKNRITAKSNQRDSIQTYRKTLENRINELKIKILLDNVELMQKNELKTELFETVVKYNQFEDSIQSADYENINTGITSVVSIDSIRQYLMTNEIIVEYSLTDTALFCFLIGNDLFEWNRISVNQSFYQIIDDYLSSIRKNRLHNFKSLSYELYKYLIQPIEKHLNDKSKLIFIPDKELVSIPFESIITEIDEIYSNELSSNHYLLKKHEIIYNYSCALWIEGHKNDRKQNKNKGLLDFVGFAPVFPATDTTSNIVSVNNNLMLSYLSDSLLRSITVNGEKYKELPFSKPEIENILEIFNKNKKNARSYMLSEANEDNFKKFSGSAQIIHIATHGIMNNEYAELSGLLFFQNDTNKHNLSDTIIDKLPGKIATSNDGILFIKEIYGLNLQVELVVLSACETGTGKFENGEGVISLARGFLYSGARNLIVSLWKVGDESTKDLMISFYKNLIKGQSKSAALRNAKLELINNNETAFPKFWSGFVLIGPG